MNRILSKWDSMALSIGVVIGIGIFRVPTETSKQLFNIGPLILLAWFVGGLISLLGALCYSELSAAFPETGGDYIFLRKSYGKLVAFLYAWTELVIIRTGSLATISFLFADYTCGLLSINLSMNKLVAISIILTLTGFNLLGLTYGSKIQNTLTITKLAAIILLILAGFFSNKGDLSRVTDFSNLDFNLPIFSSFILALVPILWTYGGWQENVFVAGETKNAGKSLPFALLGTVLVTTLVYMLINACFLYIMPPQNMASSSLVAADTLFILYGGLSSKLIEVLVMLCAIGTLNSMIITGSRITFSLSNDLPIFKLFSYTTKKNKTPIAALLLNTLGTCIFIIVGSFDRLLFFTGIAVWLFFALVVSSLFILRKHYPDQIRPFSVPGYPWLPACFILICLTLCANTLMIYTQQSMIGLAIIASGVPIFYLSQFISNTFPKIRN